MKNQMLQFFQQLKIKRLCLKRRVIALDILEYSVLFHADFLYVKCILDIFFAIKCCHDLNLTFKQDFNAKDVFFNVITNIF